MLPHPSKGLGFSDQNIFKVPKTILTHLTRKILFITELQIFGFAPDGFSGRATLKKWLASLVLTGEEGPGKQWTQTAVSLGETGPSRTV